MSLQRSRLDDLHRLYIALSGLATIVGGERQFSSLQAPTRWPKRGVYFFFEPREIRSHTGSGLRVVRVGTHALKTGASSTLRGRLSTHRGHIASGGGNHRGSILRLLVGTSLMDPDREHASQVGSWGQGSNAPAAVRAQELDIERMVSQFIGAMPFLWLAVDDEPGPGSLRGTIERNTIALLSNRGRQPIDPPSSAWLGLNCSRERVRTSGLWNQNHVDEDYDPAFLDAFEACGDAMKVVA